MNELPKRLCAGSVAGFAATGPMTLLMEALHVGLPREERDPQPPRQIVDRAAHAAGADDLSEGERQGLALVSHFGYGASAGALYGALAPSLPLPPVAGGVAYGLAVWAAGYLGWLPAAGLYRSALREPARRNALLIAAHVLWGASLGLATDELLHPRAAHDSCSTEAP